MDYQKHYNLLIRRAVDRSRQPDKYYESHHIIPRCMGGNDDKANLVFLLPEEHYIAHQLLVKMHPNHTGLVYAASMMCNKRPNNKLYGWLRRKISSHMKINNPNKGGLSRRNYNKIHGPPNKGRIKHSDETKAFLSARMKRDNPNKDGSLTKKRVKLVDILTGNELFYTSLKEAEKTHSANHASVHNNRKRNTPYKGYMWYVGI